MENKLTMTERQKLAAIEYKYYSGAAWEPKVGDYYTLTRNSLGLEVFQIQKEVDNQFGIIKVWDEHGNEKHQTDHSYFPKSGFSNEGFGLNRVYLPEFIYKPYHVKCLECDWAGDYSDCVIGKREDSRCPNCSSYKLDEI